MKRANRSFGFSMMAEEACGSGASRRRGLSQSCKTSWGAKMFRTSYLNMVCRACLKALSQATSLTPRCYRASFKAHCGGTRASCVIWWHMTNRNPAKHSGIHGHVHPRSATRHDVHNNGSQNICKHHDVLQSKTRHYSRGCRVTTAVCSR